MSRIPPYVVLAKIRGETPLQAIERYKANHPKFTDIPAAYAGRLDPMAEGKLLVLLGDECKKLKEYTGLDKEYEIEVLLDLSTDTGDTLGLASYAGKATILTAGALKKALTTEVGTHERAYPIFSSKTVNGKPLFLFALEGTIDQITVPTHAETLYTITHVHTEILSTQQLATRIETSLASVPRSNEPSKILGADFRQDAIRSQWQRLFSEIPDRTFNVITLRVVCGSGSYMRTLAGRIGLAFDSKGIALSIKRTKIGKYKKWGSFSFWSIQF